MCWEPEGRRKGVLFMLYKREKGAMSAPDPARDLGSADQLWRPNPGSGSGVSDKQADVPFPPRDPLIIVFPCSELFLDFVALTYLFLRIPPPPTPSDFFPSSCFPSSTSAPQIFHNIRKKVGWGRTLPFPSYSVGLGFLLF